MTLRVLDNLNCQHLHVLLGHMDGRLVRHPKANEVDSEVQLAIIPLKKPLAKEAVIEDLRVLGGYPVRRRDAFR